MPLLGMGREDATSTKSKARGKGKGNKSQDAEASPPDSPGSPEYAAGAAPALKRPGTSGTEHLLVTNRRQASENLARATRAERAYRNRKQATLARANFEATKSHFRAVGTHLRLGCGGLLSAARAVPHLVGERRENRRRTADARRRQRHLEQKRRLEEELARQSADADGAGGEAEATAGEEDK
ncbi:hypothetical protein GGR56DRAFT_669194 [Xylariaceae sp. FL0804]|nr:hypothetical protein GGR56DRAFT_669194 [Xylariaceae sp. FL0804]